ncbi:hypothetical protein Vafri_11937, partial [Volvox africanus]
AAGPVVAAAADPAEVAAAADPADVPLKLPLTSSEQLANAAAAQPRVAPSPSACRPPVDRRTPGEPGLMLPALPTAGTIGGSGPTLSPAAAGSSTSFTRSSEIDSLVRPRGATDAGALGTILEAPFVTVWHSIRSSAEFHRESGSGGGGSCSTPNADNRGKSPVRCLPLPHVGEAGDMDGSAGQLASGSGKRRESVNCGGDGRDAAGTIPPADADGAEAAAPAAAAAAAPAAAAPAAPAAAAPAASAAAAAAAAAAGGLLDGPRHRALLQEVEVLARIRHPNIVRLLAACTRPPHMCLVMELMETSLERLLYGNGPGGALMPLEKVLHIGLQVAVGLEYLHPTIMHRDLKPGNLLLSDAASPTPVVKLADFGLSRLQTSVMVTRNVEVGTVGGWVG